MASKDPAGQDQGAAVTFDTVFAAEKKSIKASREQRDPEHPLHEDKPELMGLAFSGGGIRSATFNLGVLQGLARAAVLHRFDYLSTVSGGGYIGSWLTRWIGGDKANIRDLQRQIAARTSEGAEAHEVRHLRDFSNYLTPQRGLMTADTSAFLASYLRNVSLNLTIIVSLFVAVLLLPQSLVALSRWKAFTGEAALVAVAGLLTVTILVFGLYSASKDEVKSPFWIALGTVAPTLAAAYLIICRMLHPAHTPTPGGWFTWMEAGALLHFVMWLGYALVLVLSGSADIPADWPSSRIAKTVGPMYLALCAVPSGALGALALWNLRGWLPLSDPWLCSALGVPAVMAIFVCTATVQLGLTGSLLPDSVREGWARAGGYLLSSIAVWLGVFAIAVYSPFLATWVRSSLNKGWPQALTAMGLSASAVAGWLLSVVGGLFAGSSAHTGGAKPNVWLTRLAKVAPYVFSVGLLVGLAIAIRWFQMRAAAFTGYGYPSIEGAAIAALAIAIFEAVVIALFLSSRVDVNQFSMHNLYRNRLVRCYLGASNRKRRRTFAGMDSTDDIALANLATDGWGPYPILNTTLNVTGGKDLGLQTRKARSFIFTPKYCGYQLYRPPTDHELKDQAAYCPTELAACDSPAQGVHLGTAMAISGAAASPNMGWFTSAPVAFLMTIFNVRLGWWMRNPQLAEWSCPGPRLGLWWLLRELLGFTADDSKFVYLSDGGHFENLALYELVRRRCRLIVVSDAGHDPDEGFGDLAAAIEKCRIDFGANITLPTNTWKTSPTMHWLEGAIVYADGTAADLLYLRPRLTGDEAVDVLHYKEAHAEFPNQSTADQWFDELQFESYRALGEHVMERALAGSPLLKRWLPKARAVAAS